MPATLHIPDPTSSPSSLLSTYKRSSVADLRVLYFNQMQALHSAIEGAAKFVPTTPGRHVVGEMEGVLSLNAATYKVVGKVKFVVLDDAVLVARRRRRNGGGGEGNGSVSEGKLVAERCWNLNEMLVLDTKDSPSEFQCGSWTMYELTRVGRYVKRVQDQTWQGDSRLPRRDSGRQESTTFTIQTSCRGIIIKAKERTRRRARTTKELVASYRRRRCETFTRFIM